jgi:Xaa-Pro dipeptidase
MGFGTIVITKDKAWLVAQSMDAARLFEEQAAGQGYELVTLRWYDEEVREKARALAGKCVASDTNYESAQNVYADLVDLHYPMTELELLRTRWLASETDRLFTSFAHSVKQGETEKDIASRLHCGHLKAGMEVDVLIVASDERCFKYRHPIPTGKPLGNYLMLHTVARRWGLHCNLTRFVHYGEPQEEVRKVYNAAANVEARVFLSLKPGVKFADILTWQKKWYAEQGYPEEWRKHFQGGPTGYVIVDAGRCLTDKVVQVNQPYEWFITVTGTKMGELAILTEKGLEISSYANSSWPGININTPIGDIIVPDLLIL